MKDSATRVEIEWAHEYDGYRRLAGAPDQLASLLRPARDHFKRHQVPPEWCGVDLLRGWAFFLAREDRHSGGGALGVEWVAVLEALRSHPDAAPAERPPGRNAPETSFPTVFSTEPKMHRDAAFLAAKQTRLREPHVAPINQYVDRISAERAAHVPYVDPDSGGVYARALLVLESPAGPAAFGSGMLSADNDDETAKNIWYAYRESRLPRTYGLHWNAVPWYVGDGKKNKTVTTEQVELGRRYLLGLLDLAPAIRVVVAMGKKAQRSVSGVSDTLMDRGILLVECPHPGPIPAGVTRGKSLLRVREAFDAVLAVARSHESK